MKYLKEFYNHINENSLFDEFDIDEMLTYIKDLGIDVNISKGTVVDRGGRDNGKKYINLNIALHKFATSDLITSYSAIRIDDDIFWSLLQEIITLRDRVISYGMEKCVIDFSNRRSNGRSPFISLTIIGEVDKSNKVKLVELEKRITAKLNSMRTDFSYGTYCRLHDDHILVKSDGLSYTDRKFNNLLNGSIEGSELSLSDFNIEKRQDKDTSDWFIKITMK